VIFINLTVISSQKRHFGIDSASLITEFPTFCHSGERSDEESRFNSNTLTQKRDSSLPKSNLKAARYVGLYFDSGERLIGIKLTDQKDSTAFRVVHEKGRTFTVSCQSFLRSIQIPYKAGSKIYKAGWDEKGKMILVKIN
jgi:hypothetical protein